MKDVAEFAASQMVQTIREDRARELGLPICPYGSDDVHEYHRILKEEYFDTAWEQADAPWNKRGVRAVLVSGKVGDYAVYLGAGSAKWVADHGCKVPFRVAQGFFPRITEARYRE